MDSPEMAAVAHAAAALALTKAKHQVVLAEANLKFAQIEVSRLESKFAKAEKDLLAAGTA